MFASRIITATVVLVCLGASPIPAFAIGQDFDSSFVFDDLVDTVANDNGARVEIRGSTIYMLWKKEYESCDPDSQASSFCITRSRPNENPPYLGGSDSSSIFLATRTIGGTNWNTPIEIRGTRSDIGSTYDLCIDSLGTVHIVYSETAGGTTEIFYRRFVGTTLSQEVQITSSLQDGKNASAPTIAFGRFGGDMLHLAWSNGIDPDSVATQDALHDIDTLYRQHQDSCRATKAIFYAPLHTDFALTSPLDTLGFRVTGTEVSRLETALEIGLLAQTISPARIAASAADGLVHIVWEDDRFLANGACPDCDVGNFANVGGDELFHKCVFPVTATPPSAWAWSSETLISPLNADTTGYIAYYDSTAMETVTVAAELQGLPCGSVGVASSGPEISADHCGILHVVWKDAIGSDTRPTSIFYRARSFGKDGKWEPPLYSYPDTVYQNANANRLLSPDLAVSSTGIVNVVWTTGEFYNCNLLEPWFPCDFDPPCVPCPCPQWSTMDRRANLKRPSGRDVLYSASNGVNGVANFYHTTYERLTYTECASTNPRIRLAPDGSANVFWSENEGLALLDSTRDNLEIHYKPANVGVYPDGDVVESFEVSFDPPDSSNFDLHGTGDSLVASITILDSFGVPIEGVVPDSVQLSIILNDYLLWDTTGVDNLACLSETSLAVYRPLVPTNASGLTSVRVNRLGGCGTIKAVVSALDLVSDTLSVDYNSVDLNGDGQVDFFDVFRYLPMLNSASGWCGDFTHDGVVNFLDTFKFLPAQNDGQNCCDAIPLTEGTFYKGANPNSRLTLDENVTNERFTLSASGVQSLLGGVIHINKDHALIEDIEISLEGDVDHFTYGSGGRGEIAFAVIGRTLSDFSGNVLSFKIADSRSKNLTMDVYLIDADGGVNRLAPTLKEGGSVPGFPTQVAFECCTPNPSVSSSVLRFGLPNQQPVELDVYDIGGRRVRTLLSGNKNPGWHSIEWDGNGAGGTRVAAGVYFVRLKTLDSNIVRKVVRLK